MPIRLFSLQPRDHCGCDSEGRRRAYVIPKFISVIGNPDDLAVIAWVLNSIANELKAFRRWDRERARETSCDANSLSH